MSPTQSMEMGTGITLADCRDWFVSPGLQNLSEDKTVVKLAFTEACSIAAEAALVSLTQACVV